MSPTLTLSRLSEACLITHRRFFKFHIQGSVAVLIVFLIRKLHLCGLNWKWGTDNENGVCCGRTQTELPLDKPVKLERKMENFLHNIINDNSATNICFRLLLSNSPRWYFFFGLVSLTYNNSSWHGGCACYPYWRARVGFR